MAVHCNPRRMTMEGRWEGGCGRRERGWRGSSHWSSWFYIWQRLAGCICNPQGSVKKASYTSYNRHKKTTDTIKTIYLYSFPFTVRGTPLKLLLHLQSEWFRRDLRSKNTNSMNHGRISLPLGQSETNAPPWCDLWSSEHPDGLPGSLAGKIIKAL